MCSKSPSVYLAQIGIPPSQNIPEWFHKLSNPYCFQGVISFIRRTFSCPFNVKNAKQRERERDRKKRLSKLSAIHRNTYEIQKESRFSCNVKIQQPPPPAPAPAPATTTTTNNQQPTTHNRQPTTDNRQPTTDNRQPTTHNPQPTTTTSSSSTTTSTSTST